MRLALAALLAVSVSGCSVALQERPRGKVASSSPSCSTSSAYWIADAALVAAGVAATIYGATRQDNTGNTIAGASAVGAVVFGASMSNGIRWGRQCDEAQQQQPGSIAAR